MLALREGPSVSEVKSPPTNQCGKGLQGKLMTNKFRTDGSSVQLQRPVLTILLK